MAADNPLNARPVSEWLNLLQPRRSNVPRFQSTSCILCYIPAALVINGIFPYVFGSKIPNDGNLTPQVMATRELGKISMLRIINRILPYMGGVKDEPTAREVEFYLNRFLRSAGFVMADLQSLYKLDTPDSFEQSGPFRNHITNRCDNERHAKSWWVLFTRTIAPELMKDLVEKEYPEYQRQQYYGRPKEWVIASGKGRFTAQQWIIWWVKMDKISLRQLELIGMDTLVMYVNANIPDYTIDHSHPHDKRT